MTLALHGTTALVTGASSGIGAATARHLAGLGAQVLVTARRRDRLVALVEEITATGGMAISETADVAKRVEAVAMVDRAVDAFGRLDIVVNAAGVMLNGPAGATPFEDWEQMVAVNLGGTMSVAKAALPHLVASAVTSDRKVADLVNISSIAGRFANARVAAYNATKFGVTAFSEALRQEFADRSVRVSVVEPGVVATELFEHQSPQTQEHYRRLFDGVESLHVNDIAEAIGYIVTRPRRVAICEMVVRPTDQR